MGFGFDYVLCCCDKCAVVDGVVHIVVKVGGEGGCRGYSDDKFLWRYLFALVHTMDAPEVEIFDMKFCGAGL